MEDNQQAQNSNVEIFCTRCGKKHPVYYKYCDQCGNLLQDTSLSSSPSPDDTFIKLVPYKNKEALISYYAGILSIIPVLGLVTGLIAIITGIRGLQAAYRHPEVRGKIHSWVGLIVGAGCFLVNFVICFFVFFAMLNHL